MITEQKDKVLGLKMTVQQLDKLKHLRTKLKKIMPNPKELSNLTVECLISNYACIEQAFQKPLLDSIELESDVTTATNTLVDTIMSDANKLLKFEEEALIEVDLNDQRVVLFRESKKLSLYSEPDRMIELIELAVQKCLETNSYLVLAPFGGKQKVATILFRYPVQSREVIRLLRPLAHKGLLWVSEYGKNAPMSYRDLLMLRTQGELTTLTENIEVLVGAFNSEKVYSERIRKSHITTFLVHAFGINSMSVNHALSVVNHNIEAKIDFQFIKTASAIKTIRDKAYWFDLAESEIETILDNIKDFVEHFKNGSTPQTKENCPTCGK